MEVFAFEGLQIDKTLGKRNVGRMEQLELAD
jgi:hypothetical protein